MNRKYSKPEDLVRMIQPFLKNGSQLQLECASDTYRAGQITTAHVYVSPTTREFRVRLEFDWIATLRIFFDERDTSRFKGIPLQGILQGVGPSFDFAFRKFYPQPRKRDRLKVQRRPNSLVDIAGTVTSELGEIIRFFRPDDPVCLRPNADGELVSGCNVREYLQVLPMPVSLTR